LEKTFGAYVETDSNIPIAKGLKSSSVAANAITLATLAALNRHLDDLSVVNLGVDASMEAKVTITGAFDDACASYFGGVVFTNNLKRKLIKRVAVKDDFLVLIQVPREKSYTTSVNVDRLGPYRSLISMAFERALRGDLWSPFMLNGMVHSIAFGYNPRIAFQAMDKGAISAGLTGTGPSVAAIVPLDKVDLVKELFSSYEGDVIEAKINLKKAHVLMSTQS
jgi:shikimate kinase